ncbi:TrmH family RNA methyltransferase [Candidatus Carsonella ruddii]|uniref:Putative RNA methyltransferase, TrmH family n=1 Tax=Candidatus Carsonella ruddii PC isolate NHV TaxID=1202540 RepID=J3TWH5_CARRU|nr:TrmH family RNA methyltransferase [Candidatus Carsonella ruddii]AFP84280.1 putative RNA methyltransferase, TrmH family [Candidatus Carsonella ruddii PC isolate NHV]
MFNFRKFLKNIKNIVKLNLNFLIVNSFYKKNEFYFNITNFFLIFNNYNKFVFKKKNFLNIYLVKNYGNINSCIRTCYMFNVYVIIKNFFFKKFLINYNNVIFIKNNIFLLKFIKKTNCIISLSINSDIVLNNFKITKNFLIIIGNEKYGIKNSIILYSDFILKINTYKNKSLNLSITNGIALYYLIFKK